ncbi:hypothetical protein EST38_g14349 [Candolleomyces aberdarensis]|uniref:Brl1/Brr6 domain-containing protein n=1 Tax=Candolleomyces aberdarensis TaxID=2316362 RepID=A0A4Q2CZW1_9AGAR|nr:hypothetical protein EST38_g14349 [Candolleomyces aberdarensis]
MPNHSKYKGLGQGLRPDTRIQEHRRLTWSFRAPGTSGVQFTYSESTADNFQTILVRVIQIAFLAAMVYFTAAVISTMQSDIRMARLEQTSKQSFEISLCQRHFISNMCGTSVQAPALDDRCNQWGLCMQSNQEAANTLALVAEYIADVIDAFVHRMSFRSLAFIMASLIGAAQPVFIVKLLSSLKFL